MAFYEGLYKFKYNSIWVNGRNRKLFHKNRKYFAENPGNSHVVAKAVWYLRILAKAVFIHISEFMQGVRGFVDVPLPALYSYLNDAGNANERQQN